MEKKPEEDKLEKKVERNKPVKRSGAAFGIVPAAILCAALARCGAGSLGLGGGAGAPGTGNTPQPAGIEAQSVQASETGESAEIEEIAKVEESGSIALSDQNTKVLPDAVDDAEAEAETPASLTEYTIEIKKDQYFIDGVEVSKSRIEEILQEENTAIRIDNNYGSQKAVSELKELFKKHDTPFIE